MHSHETYKTYRKIYMTKMMILLKWRRGIMMKMMMVVMKIFVGTLSKDDDDGSENVGKKLNLLSFKLNRVYLDPLNMLNAGHFSWS